MHTDTLCDAYSKDRAAQIQVFAVCRAPTHKDKGQTPLSTLCALVDKQTRDTQVYTQAYKQVYTQAYTRAYTQVYILSHLWTLCFLFTLLSLLQSRSSVTLTEMVKMLLHPLSLNSRFSQPNISDMQDKNVFNQTSTADLFCTDHTVLSLPIVSESP